MRIDGGHLKGAGGEKDVVFVKAGIFVVKAAAVLQVVHHRERAARHRQKDKEADVGRAVAFGQFGRVQPGAELIHIGIESLAFVGGLAARKRGAVPQVGDQIVAAIVKPGARAVACGLFGDPVHGQRKVLLAAGDVFLAPHRAALGFVQVKAVQHAGPGQQPGAAVFLLFGRAFKRPAAKPLPRRGGRGGAGRGRGDGLDLGFARGQALGPRHAGRKRQRRRGGQRQQAQGGVFHGGSSRRSRVYSGSTRRGLPSASASSATVWPPPSLPLTSASATGSSSVLRMVRRSSRAPNRVEVALTMAASAAGP